ncbi:MAG: hypothetical protein SFU98_16835 [Leptospiraceae bacterium]|nr:hypothetical protein [Leptospiraceae bacterium]
MKSGQTLCYNVTVAIGCPGNGDNGATQIGVARSYTDNGVVGGPAKGGGYNVRCVSGP